MLACRQRKLTCLRVQSRKARIHLNHQRINCTSSVFSTAVSALLAVSAFEAIRILLRNTPVKHPHVTTWADPGRAGPDHYSLARRLADHPHSPAFSGAVVGCDSEGPETIYPLLLASLCRWISQTRSACCRISWTTCSRMVCGSRVRAAYAGRSLLKCSRESALLLRLRCRAKSASAWLVS